MTPSLGQLTWRSRRGLLELDLILLPYLEKVGSSMDETERHTYARLLACDDQDVLAWINRRSEPAPDLAELIHDIREFAGR